MDVDTSSSGDEDGFDPFADDNFEDDDDFNATDFVRQCDEPELKKQQLIESQ